MFHVGIAGYKRSGKDTVAQMLIEELQALNITVERRAFADSLKEEVAHFLSEYFAPEKSYEDYLDIMHSDGTEKEQFRYLMQWWGTEGRRMMVDDNYWMDRVSEYAKNSKYAVIITPDVRFKNEINYIKNRKGIVINVIRPGAVSSEHASENDINDYEGWDYTIHNTSDIVALRGQVQQIAEMLHSYFTTSVFIDSDTLLAERE